MTDKKNSERKYFMIMGFKSLYVLSALKLNIPAE
jgi:hypothetical protein